MENESLKFEICRSCVRTTLWTFFHPVLGWLASQNRRFFQVAVFFLGGGKVKFEKKHHRPSTIRSEVVNVFWRLDFRKITSCGWLEASSYGKIWQNHFIAVNLESFNLIFLVFLSNRIRSYHLWFNKWNIFSGHCNWDPSQIHGCSTAASNGLVFFILKPFEGLQHGKSQIHFAAWTGPELVQSRGSNPCFEWTFGSGKFIIKFTKQIGPRDETWSNKSFSFQGRPPTPGKTRLFNKSTLW